jgi:cell division septation protein DedD
VEAEAVVSAEVEGGENDPDVEESSPRVEEPVSVGADFESPVVPEGAYVVQVIALQALAPAQQIAAGLVEKGFQAFVLDPFPDDPVTFYRVQVGPFAGETEAARIRDRLRSEEGLGPFITR